MGQGASEQVLDEDFAIDRQQTAKWRTLQSLMKIAAQLGLKIILVGLGIVCEFFGVEYR